MALQGIEVEGVIIKEYPPREGVSKSSGNAWKSQEYVIQTRDAYPRTCLFNVFGADRIEQFNIHQGDTVHVWFDINARAWQDRYFNDIRAFRVDHIDPNAVGGQQTTQTSTGFAPAASAAGSASFASEAPAAGAQADPLGGGSQSDDLPF